MENPGRRHLDQMIRVNIAGDGTSGLPPDGTGVRGRTSALVCGVPAKRALPKANLEEASDKPRLGKKITRDEGKRPVTATRDLRFSFAVKMLLGQRRASQ